ncbi:hypothetical protein GCK72_007561 [Caenorhabditis remanei]|uniref:BTB domain-containing protein n=1 Tax=Caenorhabditis remanei TaxID=31234 RepID=A0A6A5HP76_CAERE|nr:hypothetical protein GCK72_007561 [Caenorhabditis remanei]KAF1767602.1 hypothetical protein GCK72_007561 [Caenorhabditis remanei]
MHRENCDPCGCRRNNVQDDPVYTDKNGWDIEDIGGIESGDTGPIFIDRSPEHFDLILNYLRDEEVNLPESEEDVREILKEAEYYSLDDLVEQCKSKLPQDPSYTLKFLENDMDLLQITTTPEKAVIVFYYPVTVHGKVRWPEDLEVKSFLDKYDDEYEIYFKRAQMTRADREEWMWSIHKGDDRVDFKYHRHNFPKQSFITLFEDSVKAF